MTKQVRIENADTSDWKVVVRIYERRDGDNELVEESVLEYPTAMKETYITSTRFITVCEYAASAESDSNDSGGN